MHGTLHIVMKCVCTVDRILWHWFRKRGDVRKEYRRWCVRTYLWLIEKFLSDCKSAKYGAWSSKHSRYESHCVAPLHCNFPGFSGVMPGFFVFQHITSRVGQVGRTVCQQVQNILDQEHIVHERIVRGDENNVALRAHTCGVQECPLTSMAATNVCGKAFHFLWT